MGGGEEPLPPIPYVRPLHMLGLEVRSTVSILSQRWLGHTPCVSGKFLNFEIDAEIPFKRQGFLLRS